MRKLTTFFKGKEYVQCGRILDELGEFEIVTPASGSDLNTYFLKVSNENGKVIFEEPEKDVLSELRKRYLYQDDIET